MTASQLLRSARLKSRIAAPSRFDVLTDKFLIDNILSEEVADAIVKRNIKKHKKELRNKHGSHLKSVA